MSGIMSPTNVGHSLDGRMIESIADLGLREDEAIRLDDAALRLAALDHPVSDMAAYAKRLDDLAAQIAMAGGSAESASMRASVLRDPVRRSRIHR